MLFISNINRSAVSCNLFDVVLSYYTHYYNTIPCLIQIDSKHLIPNILFFSGEYINHDLFAFAPLGKVRWHQFGEKRLLSLSSGKVEKLSFSPGCHTLCSTTLLTNMLSAGRAENRAGSLGMEQCNLVLCYTQSQLHKHFVQPLQLF